MSVIKVSICQLQLRYSMEASIMILLQVWYCDYLNYLIAFACTHNSEHLIVRRSRAIGARTLRMINIGMSSTLYITDSVTNCDLPRFIYLIPNSWWRHHMETFSALLATCARNSPIPGEFAAQRRVTWGFDVFFLSAPDLNTAYTMARLVIWDAIAPIMTPP